MQPAPGGTVEEAGPVRPPPSHDGTGFTQKTTEKPLDPRAAQTLLCEGCGYIIHGLSLSAPCPECGRAVARSLPEHRPGTPWQRSRAVRTWTATAWSILRHPVRTFDALRITPAGARALLTINLAAAAMLIVAPWTGTLIGDPARRARGSGLLNESLVHAWVFLAQVTVVAALLWAVTRLEYYGIRFWAARRGIRLHPWAARQICAHASVGWILTGLVPMLGLAVLFVIGPWIADVLGERFTLATGAFTNSSWSLLLGASGLLGGYLAGLLAFETLVYIGVRRCRYANCLPPGA